MSGSRITGPTWSKSIQGRALAIWVLILIFAGGCVHAWSSGTSQPTATGNFSVNTGVRTDVLSFYHTIYQASEGYADRINWTGNVTTGVPGTTGDEFKDDVLRRVNFFRALVGLPSDIQFVSAKSAKCQQSALMSSANNALSHTPPSSWTFYTADGAEAAGESNLYLGSYGAGAIDGYIEDPGSSNYAVGHRRWILYSRAKEMGSGDVPATAGKLSANTLWVIGDFKPSAPADFIPWPNSGYVPKHLVTSRWSLSYPGANFSSATVAMTHNGTAVPLTVVSRTNNGYGDNTIVWEPAGLNLSGSADTTIHVTVSNLGGSGVPTSHSYSVTAFDPNILGEEVIVSGPSVVPLVDQNFTFNQIVGADAYELRTSTGSNTAWSEGAETTEKIQDLTSSSLALVQNSVKRTGNSAFHLSFPSFADGPQGFEIAREIIPNPSSELLFFDRFRWATSGSRLSAEISDNGGSTWTEIWGRNGSGSSGDSSFNARSVSLAAYAGKLVRVRFLYRFSGSTYIGTGTDLGVLLDDITVTNSTELVDTTTTALPASASSFALNATTAGAPLVSGTSYYLRIRPNVGTKWFGDGPLRTCEISQHF